MSDNSRKNSDADVESKGMADGVAVPVFNTKEDAASLHGPVSRLTVLGQQAGTVQNYTTDGQVLLIPCPSDDPNDPLNWSRTYKWYLTALVCLEVLCGNMLAAGPSVAMGDFIAQFKTPVAKTALTLTTAALTEGLSMLIWSPLIAKYGKRPVYIIGFVMLTAFAFGAGAVDTWSQSFGCRLFVGAGVGAGALVGPLSIYDIWFLHERSVPLAFYNGLLSIGVAFAIIINGWIAQNLGWRYIYWISGTISAVTTLLIIFTLPETSYIRGPVRKVYLGEPRNIDMSKKNSYWTMLKPWTGKTYTSESWLKLFLSPLLVIAFPPVLWAALTFSGLIGMVVAISSNVAVAESTTYGFGAGLIGSTYTGAAIGSILGILVGHITDYASARSSKNNKGVREPEMRLPYIVLCIIPLVISLVLYGEAVENKWHWIVICIALCLFNFAIVSGSTTAMVYAIDSYKPIASEVVTSILVYKSVVGYIVGFYVNPWIADQGYANTFGQAAAIAAFFPLCGFIMYFYGKRLRHASLNWGVNKYLLWPEERDDIIIED